MTKCGSLNCTRCSEPQMNPSCINSRYRSRLFFLENDSSPPTFHVICVTFSEKVSTRQISTGHPKNESLTYRALKLLAPILQSLYLPPPITVSFYFHCFVIFVYNLVFPRLSIVSPSEFPCVVCASMKSSSSCDSFRNTSRHICRYSREMMRILIIHAGMCFAGLHVEGGGVELVCKTPWRSACGLDASLRRVTSHCATAA